jgi:hypothetical protein
MRGAALGLSLVLFVAVVAGWVMTWDSPWSTTITTGGRIGVNGGIEGGNTWEWQFAAFRGHVRVDLRYTFYYWDTPYWKLALIAIALPVGRLGRWRRAATQRRLAARRGLCRTCGYDLRATPDRCPECGTAATTR